MANVVYMTVKQVAEKAGLRRETILRKIYSKDLRASKPAGVKSWRITEDDFKIFMNKGENRAKEPNLNDGIIFGEAEESLND